MGHREAAGVEGRVAVGQRARLEGGQGAGVEEGVEARLGEGVGASEPWPRMGLGPRQESPLGHQPSDSTDI